MLIVDASVLVKLFLAEPDSDLAESMIQNHSAIAAPDIAQVEVASAITRRFRNHEISEAQARKKLGEWERFSTHGFIKFSCTAPLLAPASDLSLALHHPLPDCVYLALANERKVPLVTADRRFVDKAEVAGANLRLLRDFAS